MKKRLMDALVILVTAAGIAFFGYLATFSMSGPEFPVYQPAK